MHGSLVPALFALAAFASVPVASAHPVLAPSFAPRVAFDEGDEESAFIAGLAERGLHEMVVREATKFLDRRARHPRAAAVRYRRASARYELGAFDESLADYRALDRVDGFEQAAEVDFRIGQCSLELGKNEEAAAAFADVRKGDADYLHVPASYLLGEALFRSGSFDEARAAYASVLKAEGKEAAEYAADARYGVVWSAWKAREIEAAVAGASEFVARHGDDPRTGEVAFLAGEALLDADRPADALEWYRRVPAGDHAEGALRGAGFALAELGEHAAAAEAFGAVVERFPEGTYRTEAALQQGVELVRAGDFEAATRALSDPKLGGDPVALYWRSTARSNADDHEGAVADARAGRARDPEPELEAQLRVACGDALFELGRADEAAKMYESSGSAYALHAAAVARLNAGDADEAERLARVLLEGAARQPDAPYHAEALSTRAEALFRLERYDEAEAALRSLIELAQPRDDGVAQVEPRALNRAYSRLGWCRWYADDAGAAQPYFARVADDSNASVTERSEARFMVGRCALAQGDEASARTAFRTYVGDAEGGPYAAEALLRLARLAEGEEAARLFQRVAERHPDSELAPTALSELADGQLAGNDLAGAAKTYELLLERYTEHPLAANARYGLGWARYQSGAFEEANEPLWALARGDATDEELRVAALELLVWVERSAKRPALARAALMAFAPRTDDESRVLAAARVADAALDEAEDVEGRAKLWSDITSALKAPDTLSAARVEQGFVALDAQSPTKARECLDAARRLAPESEGVAELAFFIGETAFEAGRDEEAAELYAIAAAHGASDVVERSLYKGGFTELRRGRSAEATAAFAALVERFPDGALAPESMFLAGEACYRAGDDAGAVGWLRRMLEAAPEHASRPKALFRLGLAEGRREEWRASVEALAALVAETPEFPNVAEAELWRGRGHARLDERRAAQQSLARVVEMDQGLLAARARIELGRLSEAKGDDEGALAEYLKVAVLYAHDEECAEALVRAGDVLARGGDEDGAAARFREVVSDYPKTEWADEARERLDG